MKPNDFIVYTLEGDSATPPTTYVGEISSADPGTGAFTFQQLETGEEFTSQAGNSSGVWDGQDSHGTATALATHDIYTGSASDPAAEEAAAVTFADGKRFLGYVQSISPTINITFYQQPCPKLSFDNGAVTESDWDAYPVGTQTSSLERYVLDNATDSAATTGTFTNGWWSLATRHDAFAGRVGAAISPFAVVVHTTDMVPESWDGLLRSWTTQTGPGDCAHFLVGRDATAGIVQLVPITNNGNHAGGTGHGSFVAGQQTWHPNLVSVGIELHCAGILREVNGGWRLVEDGTPQGNAIPESDVIVDPNRSGVAYHKVTDYQYEQLGLLLDGLEAALGALPQGCVAQSIEQPPAYGRFPTGRMVGHVSLDAAQRGDPWSATCDWMRSRATP